MEVQSTTSPVQTCFAFVSFPFTYILSPPPGARRLAVNGAPHLRVTWVLEGSLLDGANFKSEKLSTGIQFGDGGHRTV
jgi:hypothetical protein